jgi:hypothetical protein
MRNITFYHVILRVEKGQLKLISESIEKPSFSNKLIKNSATNMEPSRRLTHVIVLYEKLDLRENTNKIYYRTLFKKI